MPALSIGDCIRFGWETFKKRPGILIGAFLLAMIIPSIPGILVPGPEVVPNAPPPPPSTGHVIASLASIVLSIFTTLGATTFALRAHDDIMSVKLADLWNPQPFWRFLGAELLTALIIFVGFLLLIVPGIIASVGLGFAPYFVIDRGTGPTDSLKQSWDITKGYKWQLFLFGLALIGLNLLGLIALVVGLLVTIPVTWLAITHAYRTLSAQSRA
jgi:uncharacterized membrane protein